MLTTTPNAQIKAPVTVTLVLAIASRALQAAPVVEQSAREVHQVKSAGGMGCAQRLKRWRETRPHPRVAHHTAGQCHS